MTDERSGVLVDGDTFLLCSDGLTEHVEDHEMAEALSRMGAQEACNALVALTLERGAKDNVTVLVVRCRDRAAAQVAPGYGAVQQNYRPDHSADEWTVGI